MKALMIDRHHNSDLAQLAEHRTDDLGVQSWVRAIFLFCSSLSMLAGNFRIMQNLD